MPRAPQQGGRALRHIAEVHGPEVHAPEVHAGVCGYADGVRFTPGGSRPASYAPDVGMACPVAAGLSGWEWNIGQPAARRLLGSPAVPIEHIGSYNCRPLPRP